MQEELTLEKAAALLAETAISAREKRAFGESLIAAVKNTPAWGHFSKMPSWGQYALAGGLGGAALGGLSTLPDKKRTTKKTLLSMLGGALGGAAGAGGLRAAYDTVGGDLGLPGVSNPLKATTLDMGDLSLPTTADAQSYINDLFHKTAPTSTQAVWDGLGAAKDKLLYTPAGPTMLLDAAATMRNRSIVPRSPTRGISANPETFQKGVANLSKKDKSGWLSWLGPTNNKANSVSEDTLKKIQDWLDSPATNKKLIAERLHAATATGNMPIATKAIPGGKGNPGTPAGHELLNDRTLEQITRAGGERPGLISWLSHRFTGKRPEHWGYDLKTKIPGLGTGILEDRMVARPGIKGGLKRGAGNIATIGQRFGATPMRRAGTRVAAHGAAALLPTALQMWSADQLTPAEAADVEAVTARMQP